MKERQKEIDIKLTVNGLDKVLNITDSLCSAVNVTKNLTDCLNEACDQMSISIEQQEADAQADAVRPVNFKLLNDLVDEAPNLTYGEVIGALEMCHIPMTYAVRRLGVCCGVLTEQAARE